MLTHIVRHIFRMARPSLQTRCTDGGRRPASVTGAMTSKVKDQGHVISLSRVGGPMAHKSA